MYSLFRSRSVLQISKICRSHMWPSNWMICFKLIKFHPIKVLFCSIVILFYLGIRILAVLLLQFLSEKHEVDFIMKYQELPNRTSIIDHVVRKSPSSGLKTGFTHPCVTMIILSSPGQLYSSQLFLLFFPAIFSA